MIIITLLYSNYTSVYVITTSRLHGVKADASDTIIINNYKQVQTKVRTTLPFDPFSAGGGGVLRRQNLTSTDIRL